MSAILIFTGVEFEARTLARALGLSLQTLPGSPPVWGRLTRNGSRLFLAVGSREGSVGIPWPERPWALLGVGLAGGLAPDITPGCLVVGEQVLDDTGTSWRADPKLLGFAINGVSRLGLPHRVGAIVTRRDLAGTPAAKEDLWRGTSALAVDMESAHFLAEAHRQGIPALAIRAIADGPTMALDPAWIQVLTSRGALDSGRLAKMLISRPDLLPQAARLGWASRRALSRLGRFLPAFLGEADQRTS